MYHWTRTFFEDYPQHYRCVHELSRRTNVHRPREPLMDERLTILFVLDAIALAG
jgi:hypothetical protein